MVLPHVVVPKVVVVCMPVTVETTSQVKAYCKHVDVVLEMRASDMLVGKNPS